MTPPKISPVNYQYYISESLGSIKSEIANIKDHCKEMTVAIEQMKRRVYIDTGIISAGVSILAVVATLVIKHVLGA